MTGESMCLAANSVATSLTDWPSRSAIRSGALSGTMLTSTKMRTGGRPSSPASSSLTTLLASIWALSPLDSAKPLAAALLAARRSAKPVASGQFAGSSTLCAVCSQMADLRRVVAEEAAGGGARGERGAAGPPREGLGPGLPRVPRGWACGLDAAVAGPGPHADFGGDWRRAPSLVSGLVAARGLGRRPPEPPAADFAPTPAHGVTRAMRSFRNCRFTIPISLPARSRSSVSL
mmetsp:Transcript_41898/g.108521  ORF Transcript_41898/g.108521 Transcript_41898/m.108521 type:complete len:233 (-) Transcript_41898:765-1463(-)